MAFSLFNVPSLTLFFTFFFHVPSTYSISFQIPQFEAGDNRVVYEGGAFVAPYGATVELNSPLYVCQVGHVTYSEKVRLWDSQTGKLSDFTTHFSFIIDIENSSHYASGFAFFLAPVGVHIPPNSAGGFMGLFNLTTKNSTLNQVVLVEFDSLPNPEWDPSFEHVGINNNSLSSAVYTYWNTSFHSGDAADAWIMYNATTKNLSVSWIYQSTSTYKENSSLFYIIDLMQVLPEWVTVGFSGTTDAYIERHILQSWEFSSSLEIKEENGKNTKKTASIVAVAVSVGVVIAVMTVAFVILRRQKRMRKRRAEAMNVTSINDDLERGAGPRRFSHKDLVSATNNFSNERKLGEGGFGAVYRGYLTDMDMAIAVKKISRGSKQGKKEYMTEVKIISQLRHRNLVQLVGWCHDRGEFILVYEFMPNGSLDSHLYGKRGSLTWALRYKVTLGLASALLYLHEEWQQCVVHRDIKSSNIMLDSSFNAKLGDFGLARFIHHEQGPQTTGLAGTLGYMAPEYISTGRASKESDVYSFGIVVLEIATGRRAVDPVVQKSEMSLVEWIWDLYGSGNLLLGVDERLHRDFDEKQIECLMIVGLWCAHPDHCLRPSIRHAIQVLNFDVAVPNLPPKMPVPIYHVPSPSVSSSDPFLTNSGLELGR